MNFLTKRQKQILFFLIERKETIFSSIKLAKNFNISSRTIKKEIENIKNFLNDFSSIELQTIYAKGFQIKIVNHANFEKEYKEITNCFLEKTLNTKQIKFFILRDLILKSRFISKNEILRKFFISESTFYKLYKEINETLKNYNLSLFYSKQKGYQIKGKELDKRSFITSFKILNYSFDIENNYEELTEIYNYVLDIFLKFKYQITDIILQNISSHILLMKKRVMLGNFIKEEDFFDYKEMIDKKEYEIAKLICQKFIKIYNLDNKSFKNEIYFLTLIILGKINSLNDTLIQEKINSFISLAFKKIKKKFGINFDLIEKLRLFLVLHLVPLIYRIESKTQLKNDQHSNISQKFPQANDIALFFSLIFKENFNLEISLDELSYITLYFNLGLEELNLIKKENKILIITHLRQAETILLKHKMLAWFPHQISEIKFVHPDQKDFILKKYDAVFATESYYEKYNNAITIINAFPNEKDFKKINLALNGYANIDDILNKFNKECFYYGDVKNKYEVLKILCKNAKKVYNLSNAFLKDIIKRENIAQTSFGNLVALPHPLSPITNDTFISVAILKRPIKWSFEQEACLIMLVSIEKNNPKAFNLWYFLSEIVRNKDYVDTILQTKTFEEFISTFRSILLNKDFKNNL